MKKDLRDNIISAVAFGTVTILVFEYSNWWIALIVYLFGLWNFWDGLTAIERKNSYRR